MKKNQANDDDKWVKLTIRMRQSVKDQIEESAKKDSRSVTKWIDIHFSKFFKME